MGRRGANHTPIGKKIYALAANQAELAKILDLTQQSISGKLNGNIAITLKDLELLSAAYAVPLLYFVSGPDVTPARARSWEGILNGHRDIQQAIEIFAAFPEPFAVQLLKIVKAIRQTASHYADERLPAADSVTGREENPT